MKKGVHSTVYSIEGKELRKAELSNEVFALPYNEDVVWYAINNELANRRLGTASTKDRGEVHGSNTKPFKQKGTGHARRGDKKSPILVGGGVTFGPRPKDFSYSLPKKEKRLALKTILSLKAQQGMVRIIEDFSVESGKTKDFVKILSNNGIDEKAVLIHASDDALLKKAGANVPYVSFLGSKRLSAKPLFYARKVLIQESALKVLNEFYSSAEEAS